ncbi:MAG: proline racemase family protein [Bacteroidota bacterium]|nr:proline racemase family protein [Rhodothermia bacterium]MCS7155911.1 proline racemase family protein [Bacteroidota bacterium]MDW8138116.1 proline racemase family protein [Bacteroidota bacterium]MDW8285800.1 proline racemase family protein [Bacteroidota bacterium]
MIHRLRVLDTHTGGEPTRILLEGGPDLGRGSLAARLERLRNQHDRFRRAMLCEPRGAAHWVGAWLVEPADSSCIAGVIFFNNVGYLGMCGHGAIGLMAALAWLGRIGPGRHRLETPVGVVEAELRADGQVCLRNVPAYRYRAALALEVPPWGVVQGDVAWGGNWFFLVHDPPVAVRPENREALWAFAQAVRRALDASDIRGPEGALIDHVELLGPPTHPEAHSRNFVLCPGGQYDRSPCGTGTCAHLACLYAEGQLAPGTIWRQEGIGGALFEAYFERDPEDPNRIIPWIVGEAHVMAEANLILDERDPLCWGMEP